jgi:CRISPR/Cas system CSM-associated protein Csm5 (group 7 of RAMP superfamily)
LQQKKDELYLDIKVLTQLLEMTMDEYEEQRIHEDDDQEIARLQAAIVRNQVEMLREQRQIEELRAANERNEIEALRLRAQVQQLEARLIAMGIIGGQ